nr:reverse transcriptase domain-containing protein [Tanacetum cinerariifolium]
MSVKPPVATLRTYTLLREPITNVVLTESTTRVPPLVVYPSPASTSFKLPPAPVSSPVIPKRNPHQPPIPYPSRLNKEKPLAHMPKFAKMDKDLIANKEKLLELANTPLNENCSAVLLKKLSKKLRDIGRFLIPCDFCGLESCMSLADLGASINLMPLSLRKTLSLLELTPTRMTLLLATHTVAYLAGIAEGVFVQVGKFTFPADFVVVNYDVDPRVPFNHRETFLEDGTYSSRRTRRRANYLSRIDILDNTCEDHFYEKLNVQKSINPMSGSPTPSSDHVVASLSPSLTPFEDSDFILEEIDTFLASDDSTSPNVDDEYLIWREISILLRHY